MILKKRSKRFLIENKTFIDKNIRAIGIDDGYFRPKTEGKTKIVAVLMRADGRLEGVLFSEIEIDGTDSTNTIIKIISDNKSKFLGQAKVIFLSGVNFAGFNIADIEKIYSEFKIPIIVVLRKKPNFNKIFKALKRFSDNAKRISLIKKAGDVYKADRIFFQCKGITPERAKYLIKKFSINSHLPEPARVAHLIASASTLGRSTSP
ncbi:MAG: DUF99 family protein [Candidatus Diapherotrites archaeon]